MQERYSIQILIRLDLRCFRKTYIVLYTHILNASSPSPFPSKYLNRWANLALRDIVSEQKVFPAAPLLLLLLVLTARQINILFPIVLSSRTAWGMVEKWPLSAERVLNDGVLTTITMYRQRGRIILKVHKIENFFGSEFEFCVISLLVMLKY